MFFSVSSSATTRCAAFLHVVLAIFVAPTAGGNSLAYDAGRRTSEEDGSKRFHEMTWVSSHNAHANRDEAETFWETLAINQEHRMYTQLKVYGVRSLLIDIDAETLDLVHTFEYQNFVEAMRDEVIPFLEEDPDAIITLDIESVGASAPLLANLKAALDLDELEGLKSRVFKYNDVLWNGMEDWPTLGEMRAADQRVIMVADRSDVTSIEYGFMYKRALVKENMYATLDGCDSRRQDGTWEMETVSLDENTSWTRLFSMNHFCCDTGLESYDRIVGSNLIGGGDNGWGVLFPRIVLCMYLNGQFKPNYITADWTFEGDLQEVAQYLNFGGRLGTGQVCNDDYDCATDSCSLSGFCQCEECSSGTPGCGGCAEGEFCIDGEGGGANECALLTQAPSETAFIGTEPPGEAISSMPSSHSSNLPSPAPFIWPSDEPSNQPSDEPSIASSGYPSYLPSKNPSMVPSRMHSSPSLLPSLGVSIAPSSELTGVPSLRAKVSGGPSYLPSSSEAPSSKPSIVSSVSGVPSSMPTGAPGASAEPSEGPSHLPSRSSGPSTALSELPSISEAPSSKPSTLPNASRDPSSMPTGAPSLSAEPSGAPSNRPSWSVVPSTMPSDLPSTHPSQNIASVAPSVVAVESQHPSALPSAKPSQAVITALDVATSLGQKNTKQTCGGALLGGLLFSFALL